MPDAGTVEVHDDTPTTCVLRNFNHVVLWNDGPVQSILERYDTRWGTSGAMSLE